MVFSDGRDESASEDGSNQGFPLERTIERLVESGVNIYAVGFLPDESDQQYLANLRRLAIETNGMYVFAETAADLGDAFAETQQEILARIVLDMDVSAVFADGVEHNLTLTYTAEGTSPLTGMRAFQANLIRLPPTWSELPDVTISMEQSQQIDRAVSPFLRTLDWRGPTHTHSRRGERRGRGLG